MHGLVVRFADPATGGQLFEWPQQGLPQTARPVFAQLHAHEAGGYFWISVADT